MMYFEVLAPIHNWWNENQDPKDNSHLIVLVPFLFTILDSLHFQTRKLPLKSLFGGKASTVKIDSPGGFSYSIWLKPEEYSTLRVILALLGDLIDTIGKIKSLPGLANLGPAISSMHKEVDKFRTARDFFTHMDDILRDYEKHGIDGPQKVGSVLELSPNARNRIYLIFHENTIYFSKNKKAVELKMERTQFDQIFVLARQLFVEIVNNATDKANRDRLSIERVYPLS